MKSPSFRKLFIPALVFGMTSVLLSGGCGNIGNENPVTPQMMEEGRQKQQQERANFRPDTSRPADAK